MFWPAISTDPAVGGIIPSISLAKVVLPHPDSPTSPKTSPLFTCNVTPPTARKSSLRLNIPREIEYSLTKLYPYIIVSDINWSLLLRCVRIDGDTHRSRNGQDGFHLHLL